MPDGTPRKVLNIQKIKNLGWNQLLILIMVWTKQLGNFKKIIK